MSIKPSLEDLVKRIEEKKTENLSSVSTEEPRVTLKGLSDKIDLFDDIIKYEGQDLTKDNNVIKIHDDRLDMHDTSYNDLKVLQDDVEERLEKLDTSNIKNIARLDIHDTSYNDLKASNLENIARLNKHDTDYKEMYNDINMMKNLKNDVSGHEKKISLFESIFGQFGPIEEDDNIIKTHNTRLNIIDASNQMNTEKLDLHNDKFSRTDTIIREHSDRLSSLDDSSQRKEEKLKNHEAEIKANANKLSEIEPIVSEHSDRLSSLDDSSQRKEEKLISHESKINANTDKLTKIDPIINKHSDRLSSLDKSSQRKEEKLTSHEAKIKANTDKLTEIEPIVSEHSKQLDENSSQISTISEISSKNTEDIKGIIKQRRTDKMKSFATDVMKDKRLDKKEKKQEQIINELKDEIEELKLKNTDPQVAKHIIKQNEINSHIIRAFASIIEDTRLNSKIRKSGFGLFF